MATVRDGVAEACGWIAGHVMADGLVWLEQSNILALQQVWKDGPTSNFDEHGRMANLAGPMAYLDVQVLAAEALGRAARLPADRQTRRPPERPLPEPLSPSVCWRCRGPSATPPSRTSGCPSSATSAHAIDRHTDGRPRPLRALQSNAGWTLATSFFDGLPDERRAALVDGVVRMLLSADMLTVAGIRGRALSQSKPHFRSYHENVWPFDSAIIARGLRRHGLDELADQLEARLLNVANMLGWRVRVRAGRQRRPCGRSTPAGCRGRGAVRPPGAGLPTEMVPDEPQGWTVTALLAIKRDRAARARARLAARRSACRPPRLARGPDPRRAGRDRAGRGLRDTR